MMLVVLVFAAPAQDAFSASSLGPDGGSGAPSGGSVMASRVIDTPFSISAARIASPRACTQIKDQPSW